LRLCKTKNALASGASPRTSLRELTALPQNPYSAPSEPLAEISNILFEIITEMLREKQFWICTANNIISNCIKELFMLVIALCFSRAKINKKIFQIPNFSKKNFTNLQKKKFYKFFTIESLLIGSSLSNWFSLKGVVNCKKIYCKSTKPVTTLLSINTNLNTMSNTGIEITKYCRK